MTSDILPAPSSELRWNFRQLYWDIFWFGVLAGSTLAFQAIYAARLGASSFQIGLLSAGPAIVNLLFTLPSGRWLEGKSLIRVSFSTSIWQRLGYVCLVALPWIFSSEKAQIWGMVWITLILSAAGTVLAISFNAMFAEVVPAEWRAHAVGRRNVLVAISVTITTLVSGQILDKVVFPHNYQIVFLIGAAGAMLSSFHLSRIRKAKIVGATEERTGPDIKAVNARTYLKSLVRLDVLAGPFGMFMLAYLAFYTFQYFPIPLFPFSYVNDLHLTDGMISLGSAIFYGTMMFASFRLSYASSRYGHRKVLLVSSLVFAQFPLLMALARGPSYYYLACLIGGGVNAFLSGGVVNRLMERSPANDLPAHMAVHNMALNLGILAGSLLGPVSANLIGLHPSLFLSFGLRLLAAFLLFLWG